MDNMAYLQQISTAQNQTAKSDSKFNFSPKMLIFIGVGLAILLVIMILVNMLGTKTDKDKDLTIQADVRAVNLMDTIDNYNKHVKSSALRSMGSSLYSVLAETDRNLVAIITSDFGLKKNDIKKQPVNAEDAPLIEELNNNLENARISGLLDRVYARELTYQITLLMAIESEALARTEKDSIKSALEQSLTDLESLHTQFSEYTDYSS